ncbi:MAG: hypothetical protein ACXAC7_02765 [Candidatus Hodarchaeales archaeon]
MNVTYRNWEPNQGLEELQAKIFNHNTEQSVTAKDIIERFEREKIDPKTVRYALTEDGKPLAYVQARDYPTVKEIHIGYPWALPECPEGVQDKLFDELMAYIKQREIAKEYSIRFNVDARKQERVDFAKKKGLVVKSKGFRFYVDIKEADKVKYTDKEYFTRSATTNDIDLLVKLINADGRYSGQFENDDAIATYFKDRVFKDVPPTMVFKGETDLVMASAPLIFKGPQDDEERVILRFHSYLSDHKQALKPLISSLTNDCVVKDYGTDKLLSFFVNEADDEIFMKILEEYQPKKELAGLTYGLEE